MTKTQYRIHFRQGEFELDVEGDRSFVESYVAALIVGSPVEQVPARRRGRAPSKPAGRPGKAPKEAFAVDGSALKAFMKGRKPGSNKDRYLLYLGFLKAQGHSAASDPMVRACFSAEKVAVPPTGRQNFSILRREGLVKPGPGRGLWALTAEGEARLSGAPAKKAGPKGTPKAPPRRKAKAKPAKGAQAKGRAKATAKPKAQPAKKLAPKAKPAKKAVPKAKPARKAAPKAKPAKKVAPKAKPASKKPKAEMVPPMEMTPEAIPE